MIKIRTPLLLLATLLNLVSCGSDQEKRSLPPRLVKLRLVYEPELESLLKDRIALFEAQEQAASTVLQPQVELVAKPGPQAAHQIARGQEKTQAWIGSSSSLIEYANQNRVNLGPPQKDCVTLFATPMVYALRPAVRQRLVGTKAEIGSTQLLSWIKDSTQQHKFIHGIPGRSTSGFSALVQLSYMNSALDDSAAAGLPSQAPANIAELRNRVIAWEQLVTGYRASETLLMSDIAQESEDRETIALTTEQVLSQSTNTPLVALYPAEGSYWQHYSLCLSDADWVTAEQREVIKHLVEFLSSNSSQLAAKEQGFRPAVADVPATTTTSLERGIDLSYPKESLAPLAPELAFSLIDLWPQLMNSAVLTIAVDTSGTMTGPRLEVAISVLQQLLARRDEQKQKTKLLSFGPVVRWQHDPKTTTEPSVRALEKLRAAGASVVFDGMYQALTPGDGKDNSPTTVLVITDGGDIRSTHGIDDVLVAAKQFRSGRANQLIVVGIKDGYEDMAPLQKIAAAAGGTFLETRTSELFDTLEKVAGDLY